MIPELMEFGQVGELKNTGILYPATRDQLYWMFRQRHENGLADAFAVINGRNLFKPKRYLQIVAEQSAA